LFFSFKSTLSRLVRKIEKKSNIADKAWDKIYPYDIRIMILEAEIETNNSQYGSSGKSQRKKLRAKIEEITQDRNVVIARFESLRREHRETLAELELYAKNLTDIPANFYHKTIVSISARYNHIDIRLDYKNWNNGGHYSVNIKNEKVTCYKKFVAPAA